MSVSLTIDHLVFVANRLEDGIAHVESLLGVKMSPGGKHPSMGTHNALLGLGDTYLEVLAIDPDAPKPAHARMFDLDNFTGPPRLTNWVARTDDLEAAMDLTPAGMGAIKPVSRGDLTWRMVIPGNGKLPYDGAYPSLIQWDGTAHPTQNLADVGCGLDAFRIATPDVGAIQANFAQFGGDLGQVFTAGETLVYEAVISTPTGAKILK